MDPKNKGERHKVEAEAARKQLAEGTWPQVMTVFGYDNPKAPRKADGEIARIKKLFEEASCPNMATFIELVRFEEQERQVTRSFNLSMCGRLTPGDVPLTPTNAALLFSTPDILVGTRNGIEGAIDWFKNFSEAIPKMMPESVQIFDKIFGDAVVFLQGPSRKTTVEDMIQSVVSDEDVSSEPAEVPFKH